MADVAVSGLVLFIGSLIVAAGVAGAFATEAGRLAGDLDDLGHDASSKVRTDVEVVSDLGSQVYDVDGNGAVTLHVKNTGTRALPTEPERLDVLVDGAYQPAADLTVTVLDGGAWEPGRVVRLEIAEPGLSSGTHRVTIGVDGDTEVVEFTV